MAKPDDMKLAEVQFLKAKAKSDTENHESNFYDFGTVFIPQL